MKYLKFVFRLFLVCIFYKFCYGCECLQGTTIEDYCRSDFVAQVVILNATINKTDVHNYIEYKVKFLKTFKRTKAFEDVVENPHSVFTSKPNGSCGLSINITYTQEWFIFGIVFDGRQRLCGFRHPLNETFRSFLESRHTNRLNCTFFEKEPALVSTYCRSDFVVRVVLSNISTTNTRRYAAAEYATLYKAAEKLASIDNSSVNIGRGCNVNKILKSNQTNIADVIAFGFIGKNNTASVTDCAPADKWTKYLEERLKLGMLDGLDCSLAYINKSDAVNYRSPFFSSNDFL